MKSQPLRFCLYDNPDFDKHEFHKVFQIELFQFGGEGLQQMRVPPLSDLFIFANVTKEGLLAIHATVYKWIFTDAEVDTTGLQNYAIVQTANFQTRFTPNTRIRLSQLACKTDLPGHVFFGFG